MASKHIMASLLCEENTNPQGDKYAAIRNCNIAR